MTRIIDFSERPSVNQVFSPNSFKSTAVGPVPRALRPNYAVPSNKDDAVRLSLTKTATATPEGNAYSRPGGKAATAPVDGGTNANVSSAPAKPTEATESSTETSGLKISGTYKDDGSFEAEVNGQKVKGTYQQVGDKIAISVGGVNLVLDGSGKVAGTSGGKVLTGDASINADNHSFEIQNFKVSDAPVTNGSQQLAGQNDNANTPISVQYGDGKFAFSNGLTGTYFQQGDKVGFKFDKSGVSGVLNSDGTAIAFDAQGNSFAGAFSFAGDGKNAFLDSISALTGR